MSLFGGGFWGWDLLIEGIGLVGFIIGLGGVMFGHLPLALTGFGVLALSETAVDPRWVYYTIPVGAVLFGAAAATYFVH